jgi:hypothetical protein
MDEAGVKVFREFYGVVAAKGTTGGIVICSTTSPRKKAPDFAT